MLAIQPGGLHGGNEKLTAIRVRPRVGHGQNAGPRVSQVKVLVLEGPGAEAAEAAGAVLAGEVAA